MIGVFVHSADTTTAAALAAAVSRLGWCEALRDALGDGYRVVWRDSGDAARVTLTMSGSLPISEQQVTISAQPSAVSCSAGTPTHVQLESADGSRWARLDRLVALVDSTGAPLAPVSGAGFAWVDALVVRPPRALSALPAWLQDAPLMTWVPVSASLITDTGSGAGICAYSGATLRGAQVLLAGGGHNDYYGNEVLGLDLLQDDPQWNVVGEASPVEARAPAVYYYADGKPSATHSYWTLHWIEQHGRMFRTGGTTAYYDTYVTSPYNDAFDPLTGQWDAGAGASWPNVLSGDSGKGSVFDGTRIWEFAAQTFAHGTGRLLRCDVDSMAWTDCGALAGSHYADTPVLYDPVRNRLVRPRGGPSGLQPRYWSLDGYTSGMPATTAFAFSGTQPASWGGTSMTYCADTDRYLATVWKDTSSTIYSVNPDTFACEVLAVGGTPPDWSGFSVNDANRVYGARFTYVPELRGVLMIHAPQKPAYFFRTA